MDEITRLAHRSGAVAIVDGREVWATASGGVVKQLMIAAAEAEREACAMICDKQGREWDSDDVVTERNYAAHCAAAIRARSNAS